MSGVDALARMLPSLAVIVGALLLLRHWARRGGRTGGSPLRVVSRAGMGKGSLVAVVEVDGRRLLVGAGDQGVELLCELDRDAVDPTVAQDAPTSTDDPATPSLSSPAPGPAPASLTDDRPRMAPIDRLRAMTVRTPATSHRPRPNRVRHRT